VPITSYERIVLGHGSGGRMSHELFKRVFAPLLRGHEQLALEDQALLDLPPGGRLALTTDSFVVRPLFFPGGDIGSLAVHGTVNDLAMGGARPLYLTAAFILEEGLELSVLERVGASMCSACASIPVKIVAGDTKVVDRGKADGIFITTTGVGVVPPEVELSATRARPGDHVLVSGTLGDHGIAVLAAREGIELETSLHSDSAPLAGLVGAMLSATRDIHCLRDPTRGGLSSALNEIAASSLPRPQNGTVTQRYAHLTPDALHAVVAETALRERAVAHAAAQLGPRMAPRRGPHADGHRKHLRFQQCAATGFLPVTVSLEGCSRVSVRRAVTGNDALNCLPRERWSPRRVRSGLICSLALGTSFLARCAVPT
jgi:hydrogenase expression/formation protein HypE